MPSVHPFAAIRYPEGDQSSLVSPPYDVLNAADKQRMLARNGHNVVAIDLPHLPPKTAGPDPVYEAAGHTLRMWLESGVLKNDPTPALYPYQQTYTVHGREYQRRGLFATVRLEEFSASSSIHPHEQTFSGPKEDRLKLMRATKCNLSPVFGLYDDPSNDATDLLFEAVVNVPPLATAELPSQDHQSIVLSELWRVTDPAVLRDVATLLADKDIYIADGHHRYTTCLNYRKELSRELGVPLAHNHAANFCLFALIGMQDPGLIILPTHRVVATDCVPEFYLERFEEIAAQGGWQIIPTKFNGDSLAKLEAELPAFGTHAMGMYDPIEDRALVIRPSEADPLAKAADQAVAGKSAPWRQLDVAILQHGIFEQLLAPNFVPAGTEMHWAFPHEAHEVAGLCRSGQYRLGFLLQPTPLEAVRDLCNANELMPQKSTFFYPKLATGMVINPLE
jgi:uncharacterized protein (DUF1015 family)